MKAFKAAVIDKIVALANKYPQRHADCQYFEYGTKTPMCIIGHVLHEYGVKPEYGAFNGPVKLVSPDGNQVVLEGNAAKCINWNALGINKPTNAQDSFVEYVQRLQDSRNDWGSAVAKAKEEVSKQCDGFSIFTEE